jgi:molecular chaperone GrpE
MLDRETLTHQLLDYLETVPDLPDYLGAEPEEAIAFDPYQLVGEWIALRQEMKQQNRLMQSTQKTLEQVLTQAQTTSPEPIAQPKKSEDDGLIKDLLTVMDALDSAIAHGDDQIKTATPDRTQETINQEKEPRFWNQVLALFEPKAPEPIQNSNENWIETLTAQKAGIEMIRRSLLDVLQKRQVKPMNAVGKTFDAECMYAIAQQSSDSAPTNTVIQEVVKGYWKGDRILREAQVIVARNPE